MSEHGTLDGVKYRGLVPFVISVAVSSVVAIFFVHSYNHSVAGYVAVYAVVGMWLVCVVTVLVGLLLLIFRGTRRAATVVLAGGLALPCLFILGVRISESAGWVYWPGDRMVPMGPDVVANEVVYFNAGVTNEQVEEFHDASLKESRPDGRGLAFKPGITSYLRLIPSQAHGHEAFAIEVSPSMPQSSRERLRKTLEESPLVFRVYHDIAPAEIPAIE